MKQQFTTVLARGFADSRRTVQVRALNDDEMQELLLLARNTEWWGNRLLIDFVLKAGLNGNEAARTRISSDWVLGLNLAREIWIVTLRAIARRAGALGRLAGIARRIPFVRRYRFRDLITPGMLLMIEDRSKELDVVSFTKDMLHATVADIRVKGRKLPAAQRHKMINESFDRVVPKILETWGIDKGLFETLPQEVLPTLSHRFFAALQLAETLDWQQYHRLLDYYHAAVEDLLFRSRQLGGSDAIRTETHLATVMPRFPEIFMPMRHVPFEVCAQLFVDAEEDRLKGFATKIRVLLRNTAKQGLRRIIDSVPNWASATEEVRKEATGREMIWFLNEVGKDARVVERACYVYFDQFREAFGRVAREEFDKRLIEATALAAPDVRLVVEGPSDAIYFRAICRILLTDSDLIMAVEPRNGKADVAKRVRDLVRTNATTAVVAVLDADAEDEERELQRLTADYLRIHRYRNGAIEDQFGASFHLDTLNSAYPEGEEFTQTDLVQPFEQSIGKALYFKRNVPFEKRRYAELSAARITDADQIPETLRSIVNSAIKVAAEHRKQFPPPSSSLTIDRRTRDLLLSLINDPDLIFGGR